MALGSRPLGTRSLGDSAPTGAGIAPSASSSFVTASGSITGTGAVFGAASQGVRGYGYITGTGLNFGVGTLQITTGKARIEGYGAVRGSTSSPTWYQTVAPEHGREPYRVIIVDRLGVRVSELHDAEVEGLDEELNATGQMRFKVPIHDEKAKQYLRVPDTEVQVWRGKVVVFWGVPVRADTGGGFVNFQCKDISWYFDKRFVGTADRKNYVTNKSFENGRASWFWDVNYQRPASQIPAESSVASVVQEQAFTGSRALKLTATQAGDTIDFTYAQTFQWTASPTTNPSGELWTLSAWCYISSFTAPAQNTGGLMLERFSTTQFETHYSPSLGRNIQLNKRLAVANAPIDENSPRNVWFRLEVEILQPPNTAVSEIIKTKCSAIQGTVYWDEVTLTRKEILGFYNQDQALIAKGLVDHAQSTTYAKTSLNITTNTPLTGVKRTREYVHHEHPVISDAISEFPTLNNGMDWSINLTPTKRVFTTHFPYKGSTRRDVVLKLGKNIKEYSWSSDGERNANAVVILGDGEGSDREEGMYIDKTAFGDGLILEEVYNATPGSSIQTLDDQARRGVERFKKPIITLEVTTFENMGPLVMKLNTGDLLLVQIDDGYVEIDEYFRLIKRTLNPSTDQMQLSLRQATEELITP